MPCYDIQDHQDRIEEQEQEQERRNMVARVACTFATALQETLQRHDVGGDIEDALSLSGLPLVRQKEALDWWKAHQAQDALIEKGHDQSE